MKIKEEKKSPFAQKLEEQNRALKKLIVNLNNKQDKNIKNTNNKSTK